MEQRTLLRPQPLEFGFLARLRTPKPYTTHDTSRQSSGDSNVSDQQWDGGRDTRVARSALGRLARVDRTTSSSASACSRSASSCGRRSSLPASVGEERALGGPSPSAPSCLL